MRQIPLSKNLSMLTGQREAPAWQLIIDNEPGLEQPVLASKASLRLNQLTLSQAGCVCSAAAPACCPKPAGVAMDWWAESARRARFFFVPGLPWTVVTDQSESHQLGNSFAVSFNDPGLFPQGEPPPFAAGFFFVAPSTDFYNFALDKVQAHLYPLSDGTLVCLRNATNSSSRLGAPFALNSGDGCIARGAVDQLNNVRDGGWQRALSHVPLVFNESYELIVEWDSSRGGYAAVDALLVESETLYNGGTEPTTEVTVGAMDARIMLYT
jgi:hypothetical protein